MDAIHETPRDRGKSSIDPATLTTLRSSLRGELLLPGEPGYDEARTIWNAMIDRRPAVIVRARGAADVMRAIAFARAHDLVLAVRGGGHNIAGNAVCDGRLVRASATENTDLFWAIRGGGGNFGVVTSFEFQLHPIGPEVFAGLVVYPFDQAKKVLTAYRDWTATLPDEATVWVVMRKAPPLPFLPAEVHGREVVVLAMCYAGDPARGEQVLAPARGFAAPAGEHVGIMPFVAWQKAFDPLLAPGARNYWKSHNFSSVNEAVLDALIAATARLPSPHCEVFLGLLGGQAGRADHTENAWAHRDANFVANVHGRWETSSEDARGIAWARELFTALTPHATGGVYLNFMTADEKDRVRDAYGASYHRLAAIKRKYDPDNVFRMNQNISPR